MEKLEKALNWEVGRLDDDKMTGVAGLTSLL